MTEDLGSRRDWEELWALFEELVELSPEDRRVRLERVTARDPMLADEVQELIAAEAAGLSMLDRSPWTRQDRELTPSFEPGSIVADRFEIVRLLGAGGAGEVYEAIDNELDRRVALKSMHPWVAQEPTALARFRREIQLAQKVTHRNVCRVFDLVREGDRHFVTMELLEGRTLGEVLRQQAPLGLSESLEIAQQIAAALEASHTAGVVHRDLKPENVVLVDDSAGQRAVVTDFGLAILAAGEDTTSAEAPLTETGTTVGTPAYMAPEQLESADVSPATDVYALGLILFEMVTGTRPFSGGTAFSEARRRLEQPAPSPRERRPDLDPRWDRVIGRCLERRPRDRFESPDGVARALADPSVPVPGPTVLRRRRGRIAVAILALLTVGIGIWWQARESRSPPPPDRVDRTKTLVDQTALEAQEQADPRSIAVLPFVDMSPEDDQEYFADGISEELVHLLAGISDLRVTSRSSSFSFKGQDLRLDEIARRLGVAHLLEGSVRTDGNEVRVTAQLIDARSDTHLWSKRWDRNLEDIFAIQDEIARAVASELQVTLLGERPQVRSADPLAHALTLRARKLWWEGRADLLSEIFDLYYRAVELDPDYAAAWVGLADVYTAQASRGLRPAAEGHRLAREAAERAVELDPGNAWAHRKLSLTSGVGNYAEGVPHMLRALALAPSDPRVIGGAAIVARTLGRIEEAVALAELRVDRDPLGVAARGQLGRFYYLAGRPRDALAAFETAMVMTPRAGVEGEMGLALLAAGDFEAALQFVEQEETEWYRLKLLAIAYHASGRTAESDEALSSLIEGHQDFVPFSIACVYAQRREIDLAFHWLDRAVQAGDGGLSGVHTEPLLAPLHHDPRWLPLLRQFNKAPEQLAAISFEVDLPPR